MKLDNEPFFFITLQSNTIETNQWLEKIKTTNSFNA